MLRPEGWGAWGAWVGCWVGCRASGWWRKARFRPFLWSEPCFSAWVPECITRMHFFGVVRAAWGAGCAHMLFQTVSYTVVCVVLRDRHVENDHSTPYVFGCRTCSDSLGRATSHSFVSCDCHGGSTRVASVQLGDDGFQRPCVISAATGRIWCLDAYPKRACTVMASLIQRFDRRMVATGLRADPLYTSLVLCEPDHRMTAISAWEAQDISSRGQALVA